MAEAAGEERDPDVNPIRRAQLQTTLEMRDGAFDLAPLGIYTAEAGASRDDPERQSRVFTEADCRLRDYSGPIELTSLREAKGQPRSRHDLEHRAAQERGFQIGLSSMEIKIR